MNLAGGFNPVANAGLAGAGRLPACPKSARTVRRPPDPRTFAADLAGVGTKTGALSADFNDGTSRSIAITGNTNGDVQCFGFTDGGKSISQVAPQRQSPTGDLGDDFGIDDVRYVGATAVVPEPLPLVQRGAALLAVLGYRVTRRLRRRG